jgi:hypothetical protein
MNFSALNTHAIGVVSASAGAIVEGAGSFSAAASVSASATLHSHATAALINSIALTTTQSVVRFAKATATLGCAAAANVEGYRTKFTNAQIVCAASSNANAFIKHQAVASVAATGSVVSIGSRVAFATASLQADASLTANSGKAIFAQSTMESGYWTAAIYNWVNTYDVIWRNAGYYNINGNVTNNSDVAGRYGVSDSTWQAAWGYGGWFDRYITNQSAYQTGLPYHSSQSISGSNVYAYYIQHWEVTTAPQWITTFDYPSANLVASATIATAHHGQADIAASASSAASAYNNASGSADITAHASLTESSERIVQAPSVSNILGSCSLTADSAGVVSVQCTLAASSSLTAEAIAISGAQASVSGSCSLSSVSYNVSSASATFTGSSIAISVGHKKSVAHTTINANAAVSSAANSEVYNTASIAASAVVSSISANYSSPQASVSGSCSLLSISYVESSASATFTGSSLAISVGSKIAVGHTTLVASASVVAAAVVVQPATAIVSAWANAATYAASVQASVEGDCTASCSMVSSASLIHSAQASLQATADVSSLPATAHDIEASVTAYCLLAVTASQTVTVSAAISGFAVSISVADKISAGHAQLTANAEVTSDSTLHSFAQAHATASASVSAAGGKIVEATADVYGPYASCVADCYLHSGGFGHIVCSANTVTDPFVEVGADATIASSANLAVNATVGSLIHATATAHCNGFVDSSADTHAFYTEVGTFVASSSVVANASIVHSVQASISASSTTTVTGQKLIVVVAPVTDTGYWDPPYTTTQDFSAASYWENLGGNSAYITNTWESIAPYYAYNTYTGNNIVPVIRDTLTAGAPAGTAYVYSLNGYAYRNGVAGYSGSFKRRVTITHPAVWVVTGVEPSAYVVADCLVLTQVGLAANATVLSTAVNTAWAQGLFTGSSVTISAGTHSVVVRADIEAVAEVSSSVFTQAFKQGQATASASVTGSQYIESPADASLAANANVIESSYVEVFATLSGISADAEFAESAVNTANAQGAFTGSSVTVSAGDHTHIGRADITASAGMSVSNFYVESWRQAEATATAAISNTPFVYVKVEASSISCTSSIAVSASNHAYVQGAFVGSSASVSSSYVSPFAGFGVTSIASVSAQAEQHHIGRANIVAQASMAVTGMGVNSAFGDFDSSAEVTANPNVLKIVSSVSLNAAGDFTSSFAIVAQEGSRSNGIHILVEAEDRTIAVTTLGRSMLIELDLRTVYAEAA